MVSLTGPEGQLSQGSPRAIDSDAFAEVLRERGATWVASRLAPYVTAERQARIEAVLDARVASLQIAIEDPRDPHNVAAIVRTSEALGAGAVHAIGVRTHAVRSRRVTRGAFYWSEIRQHAGWAEFVAAVGPVRLAAACIAPRGDAVPLDAVPVDRPLCLVFGNEQSGLTADACAACDLRFWIPMFGMSESLNVSVSAAIAVHALLARRRAILGAPGDMEPAHRALLRARWYAKSIDERLLWALLSQKETRLS